MTGCILEHIDINLTVPAKAKGERLDKWLATQLADYSRSRLQQWIAEGAVLVDGLAQSANFKLKGSEMLHISTSWQPAGPWEGEAGIDLDVHYEDDDLLIVNKPAGLITHPGTGNRHGTLANALLYRYPKLAGITRAGIVHRLDKDTSGIMMVAHSEAAYQNLVQALRLRRVTRRYIAVLKGRLMSKVKVSTPIGRHPRQRTLMAVTKSGRDALTYITPIECFNTTTLAEIKLETGRTHQIRVHAASIHYPVLGDAVYGSNRGRPQAVDFPRQALHAKVLTLAHPGHGKELEFKAQLPPDLTALLRRLRADSLTMQGDS